MSTTWPFRWILVLAVCQSAFASLPLQLAVNAREGECLYETLELHETLTVSLFVLSGEELKANIVLDGPVAHSTIQTGRDLQTSVDAYDSNTHGDKIVYHKEVVDFEHLNIKDEFEEFNRIEYDDDIVKNKPDDRDLTPEERRKIKDRQRKKILEKRQKQEKQKIHQHKKIRDEGQPYQKTVKAPTAGWYRFCVTSTRLQITAEVEMRKESVMGGLNEEGHVLSYDEKSIQEEDKLLDEDSAAEEGIKDEDFESTKDKLRTLRRLLADIHSKQQTERRRLIVHSNTNKHSHSQMVLSSLFETVLFMAVTGYQVYTIRRWFRAAPALGR